MFYQKSITRNRSFEQHYTELRKKEGRLYDDQVVRLLPDISSDHFMANEWKIRKHSTERLIRYLKKQKATSILEIGCGNGWLINRIHQAIGADCCGVDVNETELMQAARIFRNDRLNFVYAEIMSGLFSGPITDVIVIASALQYFSDPPELLKELLPLLNPNGSIHIIDTPFYNLREKEKARERSLTHFQKHEEPAMQAHYFHHSLDCLRGFNYRKLYDPTSLGERARRLFSCNSPFPWIIITR